MSDVIGHYGGDKKRKNDVKKRISTIEINLYLGKVLNNYPLLPRKN